MSHTPSQTIGPFFGFAIAACDVVAEGVTLHGVVTDGEGAPVTDALVETWQPEGIGRCATDADGRYAIRTVKPKIDGAPHVDVLVFARGLLRHVLTRVYFPGEDERNARDPVLALVDASRRHTLIAVPDAGGLRFDIRLQGDGETVFFAR